MLMLEDLKRKPDLMTSFEHVLMQDCYIPVILNNKVIKEPKALNLTKEQAVNCKINFNKADLAFAGTNHGIIIKPLFALKHNKGDSSAFVSEYLTFSNDSNGELTTSTIENDITMLAIAASIFYPDITEIHFTGNIIEFENKECSVNKSVDSHYILSLK